MPPDDSKDNSGYKPLKPLDKEPLTKVVRPKDPRLTASDIYDRLKAAVHLVRVGEITYAYDTSWRCFKPCPYVSVKHR